MIRLVALYGVGDCYLVCGLVRAFEKHHGIKACVVVKSAQSVIPGLFKVKFEVNDELVKRAEGNDAFHKMHWNIIQDGATVYVHPHFIHSYVHIDQLTVKPRVSQADMYRALLHLPPWMPLEIPRIAEPSSSGEVLLIPKARSWPNLDGACWDALAGCLRIKNISVRYIDPTWSLSELLWRCAAAKHVIGPQCGVMSVLIEAGFPCRKTLAITELSPANPYLFGLTETMPYGHCSTFAGNDHPDVRHFVVSPTNWEEAVERIAMGS